MVRVEKLIQALKAQHALRDVARRISDRSYRGKNHDNIVDLWEAAENLPLLILDETDKTEIFRDCLVGLIVNYPEAANALEIFDSVSP